MSINCNDKFVKGFVSDEEISALVPSLKAAH